MDIFDLDSFTLDDATQMLPYSLVGRERGVTVTRMTLMAYPDSPDLPGINWEGVSEESYPFLIIHIELDSLVGEARVTRTPITRKEVNKLKSLVDSSEAL